MVEADRAIRWCAECGDRLFMAGSCAAFAVAAAAAGIELDRALEALDEGENVIAETGARGLLPLLDARARVHEGRDVRREILRRGLQVAESGPPCGLPCGYPSVKLGRHALSERGGL
jgi:hypothetical protein